MRRPRRLALVTGASSGLGAAFARELARRGYALWLVARRRANLEALASELSTAHGVTVDVTPADLADAAALNRLAARVADAPDLALLVNNAGFGARGRLWETSVETQAAMLRVHGEATLRLCHAAIPRLLATRGGIVNVASIGALIPKPLDATYCATKAFVVTLTIALADELRGSAVHVQALCPGFTRTGFYDTDAYAALEVRLPSAAWMTAAAVARRSLDALGRGRVVFVPGTLNRAAVALARSGARGLFVAALERRVAHAERPRGPHHKENGR